jgi:hypothetical protein
MSEAKKKFNASEIASTLGGGSKAFIVKIQSVAKNAAKTGVDGAVVVAGAAVRTGNWLGERATNAINNAYAVHKPIAEANLARLRKSLPSLLPVQMREVLAEEYFEFVSDDSKDASANLAATKLYVLSVVELHGNNVASDKRRQALLAEVLLATSGLAQFALKNGVAIAEVILAYLSTRTGGATKVASQATAKSGVLARGAKAIAKGVGPAAAEAAINHAKSRSVMAQAVVANTKRMLGPAPAAWPAAAKKPVAKKPVARKAKPSA